MIVSTILIAAPIAALLHTLRRGPGDIRRAWKHASRLERAALMLAFVPIPGPIDDIVAAIILARVLRRAHNSPHTR